MCFFGAFLLAISACSSSGFSKIKDGALELVGVRASGNSGVAAGEPPRNVDLKIFAGRSLNADERGRGTAVVVRVYRLRDAEAFLQAPYEAFGTPDTEKALFDADLLDVKELIVKPGEALQRKELLGGDASYLGVVALYRSPSPDRWRLVFNAADKVNAKGIWLGLHACATTVSQGIPYGARLLNPGSLGGVVCR